MQIGTSHSQSGMSLVAVLIAVAVIGMVAASIATLSDSMVSVTKRASISSEAESLERFVITLLAQKEICLAALRPDPLAWPAPNSHTDITSIVVPSFSNAANASEVASIGKVVAPGLTITAMHIRARDLNNNRLEDDPLDPPLGAPIRVAGIDAHVIRADLVIRMRYNNPLMSIMGGGELSDRVIPLIVAITDAAPRQIVRCDVAEDLRPSVSCDPTVPACAALEQVDSEGTACGVVAYVDRMDAQGIPLCDCKALPCPPPWP